MKKQAIRKVLNKKALRVAKHPLISCAIIFLTTTTLGFIFYYIYGIWALKINPAGPGPQFLVDDAAHEKILEVWERRQGRFEEAALKEYPVLFENPTPVETPIDSAIP